MKALDVPKSNFQVFISVEHVFIRVATLLKNSFVVDEIAFKLW